MSTLAKIMFAIGFAVGCGDIDVGSAQPPLPKAPQLAQAEPAAGKVPPSKVNAPDVFKVKFETTKGDFVIEAHREWAPNGADHFYELIGEKYYDGCKFFRVVPKFMVQFGINGDPKVDARWKEATIRDDKVIRSNKKGFVTYAQTSSPNSRSTQLFVNYGDNSFLDNQRFAPFGQVVEGMDVVEKINAEYGETPDQRAMHDLGDAYLTAKFPNLDMIKTARIVE